jgi:WD40 repeat protein
MVIATGAGFETWATKVWDTSAGKVVWEPPAGELVAFFTPDGGWLVTSPPGDAPLRLWQVGSWAPGPTLPKHAPNQVHFEPSPDGTVLVPLEGGRTPRLVHAATGKELATLEAPRDGSGLTNRRFNPDGTGLPS